MEQVDIRKYFLHGSNSEPQHPSIYLNNWRYRDLTKSEAQELLCSLITDHPPKDSNLAKKVESSKSGMEIGLLTQDGKLKFYNWWELIDCFDADFLRLLSKGIKFRIAMKPITPEEFAEYEWKVWLRLAEIKGCDVKSLIFRRTSHYSSKTLLRKYLQYLSKYRNIIVRREDRGYRFVIIQKAWEVNQLQFYPAALVQVQGKTEKSPSSLYFVPKTHKNEIKGRPITSAPHSNPDLGRKVNAWLKEVPHIAKSSSEHVMLNWELIPFKYNNWYTLVGDIDSLYTSVPLTELRKAFQFFGKKPPSIRTLQNVVKFYGNTYIQPDGLSQGESSSPALANLYCYYKEHYTIESGWIKSLNVLYRRYVDDIFLLGDSEESLKAAKRLVDSLFFPLKLNWNQIQPFAQHQYMSNTTTLVPQGKKERIVLSFLNRKGDIPPDLGAVPKTSLRNRINSFLATWQQYASRHPNWETINSFVDCSNDPELKALCRIEKLCNNYSITFIKLKEIIHNFGNMWKKPPMVEFTFQYHPLLESAQGRKAMQQILNPIAIAKLGKKLTSIRTQKWCVRWKTKNIIELGPYFTFRPGKAVKITDDGSRGTSETVS